jgi:putative hemolysin
MSLISDEALAESLHLNGRALSLAKWLLAIDEMNVMHRSCAAETGWDSAAAALRFLGIRLIVRDDAFAALTPTEPMAIICNHPFGLLDGLILIKLVGEHIRNFKVVVNYLLSGIEALNEHFVFVNSFDDGGDKRSNVANLRTILRLPQNRSSVVIFPAGDVSSFQLCRLRVEDRKWDLASTKLIRKLGVPIVPVYISGRNSVSYQLMNGIHRKLGLLRLPRELLHKRGRAVRVATGPSFSLTAREMACDPPSLAETLKRRVYALRDQTR